MARANSSLPAPLGPSIRTVLPLGRNIRQDIKNPLDLVIFADDVFKAVLVADLFAECFHGRQISENFYAADNLSVSVFEHRCADTGRNRVSLTVEDINGKIDALPAGFHGFAQGTDRLADIGSKNIKAFLSECLITGHAGNILGSRC